MIDRTVEEFGEDYDEEDFYFQPRTVQTVSVQYSVQYSCTTAQYNNNHTSQYTLNDPVSYHTAGQYPSPPPAHEDQTQFLPPPPALPLPEFTSGCHKGSDVEFSDPHEEKTFTVLLSEDDTSSLITSAPVSPSREVLDLSLPKKDDSEEEKLTNGDKEDDSKSHNDNECSEKDSEPEKSEVKDEAVKEEVAKEEIKEETKVEPDENFEDLEEDCTISIEPSSLPVVPKPIIAIQSQLEEYLSGLTEEEWLEFEESGILGGDDEVRRRNDQCRLDCKYCGIIFSSIHVRKFHEESHKEAKEEERYDDGEDTRLFCGFCGKSFSSIKFRKIHEMTHTEEDLHLLDDNSFDDLMFSCQLCGRQFRLESDLVAHRKLFCTAKLNPKPSAEPKPAKQPQPGLPLPQLPPLVKSRPRLIDQEGWLEDPSLPLGWRMKTRPRPSQEGQFFSLFLSPDNKVFHSRKGVIEQMKMMGGYTQLHYDRVKEGGKPGPRKMKKRKGRHDDDEFKVDKKRRKEGLYSENSLDSTMNSDDEDNNSDLDADDSDSEAETDLVTAWRDHHSLLRGWKMRAVETPSGKTFFQYKAPDETVVHTRREMKYFDKKPASPKQKKAKSTLSEAKQKLIERMENIRKKLPKKKKLVTNQVIVTKATNKLRTEFLSEKKNRKNGIGSRSFRSEPTILIPNLKHLIPDPEDLVEESEEFSINFSDLKEIDHLPNNTKAIKRELRERQKDYESKVSSSEDEDDPEPEPQVSQGRSLRKRNARLVYEEPPLEDELDLNFYKNLRTVAGSVEKNSGKSTPAQAEASQEVSTAEEESDEEDVNDEDYLTDSWESELFSLKKNPRDSKRFQDEDTDILNDWFNSNPYPDKQDQIDLSKILMVQKMSIKYWFQSKRVKCKEKGIGLTKKEIKKKVGGDEEEYQYCKTCKQSFSCFDHLKLHMKRFHKKKLKKLKSQEAEMIRRKVTRSVTEQQVKVVKPEPVTNDLDKIDEYLESKNPLTLHQVKGLKKMYNISRTMSDPEATNLSKQLNMTENAVKGWFNNQRKMDDIEEEVKERIICSPSILKHFGRNYQIEREKWMSNRNKHCQGKRSSMNHFQKTYLKYYFMQKQFVDDDDLLELTNELMLPSTVIEEFFDEARDRKDIDEEQSAPSKGRSKGRSKKISLDQSKIAFDSDDEDLFEFDNLEAQTSSLPIVFASKSRGASSMDTGSEVTWTLHQKTFLEKFYDKVEEPNDDDLDFLFEHLKTSRQDISDWFIKKKKDKEYEKKDSVVACKDLLSELILSISESKNFSFQPWLEYSCKYCGDKFTNETELQEHESIEAEEFEPENFEEQETQNDTNLQKVFMSDEEEDEEEETNNYASSYNEDSVDISISSYKNKFNGYQHNSSMKTSTKKFEFDEFSVAEPPESIRNVSRSFIEEDHSRSNLYYDDEPVSFDAFRTFFDSEDVEPGGASQPQNLFDFNNSFEKKRSYKKKKSVNTLEARGDKAVRKKIRFTDVQRGILLKSFHQSLHMSKHDFNSLYEELAETLDLPVTNIKVWFQNAKSARKKGNPIYV